MKKNSLEFNFKLNYIRYDKYLKDSLEVINKIKNKY